MQKTKHRKKTDFVEQNNKSKYSFNEWQNGIWHQIQQNSVHLIQTGENGKKYTLGLRLQFPWSEFDIEPFK